MPRKPTEIYLPAFLFSLTWRLLGIDSHMGVMSTFLFCHVSPPTHLSTHPPTHTRWLLTLGSRHNSRYSMREMQLSSSSDSIQQTWDTIPRFSSKSRHFAPATGRVGYLWLSFSPLRISLGQRSMVLIPIFLCLRGGLSYPVTNHCGRSTIWPLISNEITLRDCLTSRVPHRYAKDLQNP